MQCAFGEVEDEAHFVLRCEALLERRNLLRHMELVDGWQGGEEGAGEVGDDIRASLY